MKKQRLLARKEAREFFALHPELRERHSDNVIDLDALRRSTGGTDDESAALFALEREYLDYDVREDEYLSNLSPVSDALADVREAIGRRVVSAVCDATARLAEVLQENAGDVGPILDALERVVDLLDRGAKTDARLLDGDEQEAYEVTELCRGMFRVRAKGGIAALRSLEPREFEGFVGELLAQHGLQEVDLTNVVADDGVDLVAFHVRDGKRVKYIVQCKRYAASNRIDVRIVRELAGVKMDVGAHYALLVVTTDLTRPARSFVTRNRGRVWGVRVVDARLLARLLALTD